MRNLPPLTRLLFVFHAAGAVQGEARIFTPDPEDFAVRKAFTWVDHSPETGEMPVRTIDSPSWLAPSPTSVCVSAVDQVPPQIGVAAPNPSIVWYLVALLTVMSAGPVGGGLVGPVVGEVVGEVVGAEVVGGGWLVWCRRCRSLR